MAAASAADASDADAAAAVASLSFFLLLPISLPSLLSPCRCPLSDVAMSPLRSCTRGSTQKHRRSNSTPGGPAVAVSRGQKLRRTAVTRGSSAMLVVAIGPGAMISRVHDIPPLNHVFVRI